MDDVRVCHIEFIAVMTSHESRLCGWFPAAQARQAASAARCSLLDGSAEVAKQRALWCACVRCRCSRAAGPCVRHSRARRQAARPRPSPSPACAVRCALCAVRTCSVAECQAGGRGPSLKALRDTFRARLGATLLPGMVKSDRLPVRRLSAKLSTCANK